MGTLYMKLLIFNIQLHQMLILLLYISEYNSQFMNDYWSKDFDASKNCEDERETERLRMLNPSQCKSVRDTYGNREKTFQNCKIHLHAMIEEKCEYSKIENPGNLLY